MNESENSTNQSLNDIMPTLLDESATATDAPAEASEAVSEASEAVQEAPVSSEQTEAQNEQNPAPYLGLPPEKAGQVLDTLENTLKKLGEVQERNAQLEKLLSEQNAVAAQTVGEVVESAPILDYDELAFLSVEDRNQRIKEFSDSVADYASKKTLEKLSPIIGEYDKTQKQAQLEAAYGSLASMPEFADIANPESREGIERILSNTPELESVPLENRLMLAYLAQRGVQSVNTPPVQRTAADIAKEAMSSPEVMKLIAEASYREAQNASRTVPPQVPSHGYGNAPVTVLSKPKSIDEVTSRLYDSIKGR